MSALIERRKAEWDLTMKSSISEAAISVFNEYGFAGLKMARVANAADVAKGTLYNYFTSKEDIYVEIIQNTLDDHKQFILNSDRTKQSLYEFIFDIMQKLLTYSCRNRAAHLLMVFTGSLSISLLIALPGRRHTNG